MSKATRFAVLLMGVLISAVGPAVASRQCPHPGACTLVIPANTAECIGKSCVPRASWVRLRDDSGVVRGWIEFTATDSQAEVVFHAANGDRIEQAVKGPIAEQELPQLVLEPDPYPDAKTDEKGDIKVMKEQINVLYKNVAILTARVNGRQ